MGRQESAKKEGEGGGKGVGGEAREGDRARLLNKRGASRKFAQLHVRIWSLVIRQVSRPDSFWQDGEQPSEDPASFILNRRYIVRQWRSRPTSAAALSALR